jgi:uncharacterized protein YehS (DUF1456 family)
MRNNDILRSLRYMLKMNNPKMADLCGLAGYLVTHEEIEEFLKPELSEESPDSPDEVVAYLLDGLIISNRGKDPLRPTPPLELPMTNNLVLKKLRVAFQLQEEDMHAILESSGFKIGKSELSALMRKRDHGNYRECGDQVLRNFLKGLTLRLHSVKPT